MPKQNIISCLKSDVPLHRKDFVWPGSVSSTYGLRFSHRPSMRNPHNLYVNLKTSKITFTNGSDTQTLDQEITHGFPDVFKWFARNWKPSAMLSYCIHSHEDQGFLDVFLEVVFPHLLNWFRLDESARDPVYSLGRQFWSALFTRSPSSLNSPQRISQTLAKFS